MNIDKNLDPYNSANDFEKISTDNSTDKLRAQIIASIPSLNTAGNPDTWWLLGTTGCHLCRLAEEVLSQFQAVQPITYQYIDIADFDESLMMRFATTIPVIMTPTQRLNYPFSVLDLQQLLAKLFM